MGYKTGKSKEFRGLVSTGKVDLLEVTSPFSVTIEMKSGRLSNIHMTYSKSPGNFCIILVHLNVYSSSQVVSETSI